MQKNTVTVIDIGSSGITAAAVENGLNNTFVIKGFSRQNYAGFSEGEFFDRTELEGVLRTCLKPSAFRHEKYGGNGICRRSRANLPPSC